MLKWIPGDGFIFSNSTGKVAGNNGYHTGVLYEGKVYCTIHPSGLSLAVWMADFIMTSGNTKLPPIHVPF